MNAVSLIFLLVVMFAAMYFLMIRPQKKQMDKQREMLNKVEPGARVMLTSGIFGTIRATGDKQLVVELAPGVDITVVKQAVTKVVQPDEEEFEFADPDAGAEPDGADEAGQTAGVAGESAEDTGEQQTASTAGRPDEGAAEQGSPAEAPAPVPTASTRTTPDPDPGSSTTGEDRR